ncbi:MAG TPA: FliH/SctL family protein [Polyangiaceae bacterium]
MAEGPRRATFHTVQGGRSRVPSWLPSARRGKKNEDLPAAAPSLKPPPLPSEFVDAIRQELEPEPEARPRASDVPPRPSASPVFAAAGAPPVVEPVVDPELNAAFERAIELLTQERARVLEQTASQLGELAAIIARRVIAHEISLNPEVVAGLVREGLEALGAHDRVVVRVGRAFADSCDSLAQRLSDRGAQADVRVDLTLPEHGCLVETELGRVDESIETRIATLLEALKPDSDRPRDAT